MSKTIKFLLNGCDINFVAEAPADSKRSSHMRIKFELMEHDLLLYWYQN